MTAILYRMQAGFPGEVNRTHPASIEPALNDVSNPITQFGQFCLNAQSSANSVRLIEAGDASQTAYAGGGIAARPFPFQPSTATNYGAVGYGSGGPTPGGEVDVLRSGYIISYINGSVEKGNPVFVWAAASSGSHVQGNFESQDDSGSTLLLDNKSFYNGPTDANGYGEIAFNL